MPIWLGAAQLPVAAAGSPHSVTEGINPTRPAGSTVCTLEVLLPVGPGEVEREACRRRPCCGALVVTGRAKGSGEGHEPATPSVVNGVVLSDEPGSSKG